MDYDNASGKSIPTGSPEDGLSIDFPAGRFLALLLSAPPKIGLTGHYGGGKKTMRKVIPTPRARYPLHHAHGIPHTTRMVCTPPCAWYPPHRAHGIHLPLRTVSFFPTAW